MGQWRLSSSNASSWVGGLQALTYLGDLPPEGLIAVTFQVERVNVQTMRDTLVPRDQWTHDDWFPSVHVDSDRCFGTLDRDGPLTTDPAWTVLAVKLLSHHGRCVLLTVRIHTFIERGCSRNPDACVPWDVWGMTVMEIPTPRSGNITLVQGVRVILVRTLCSLRCRWTPPPFPHL